ncbi:MAG: signal peptidase II [Candidatus Peregrinibacteria bacterium]|nr:signal peptidase II [Candidatus Peregrinibacteria bacterium]
MKNKFLKLGIWCLILIALDQLTKYLVHHYMQVTKELLGNFLRIEYSQNTGVAFGLPVPYPFLIVGNVLLMGLIVWIINKEFDMDQPIGKLSLVLIISGALGNVIDRLIRGFVIDFIGVLRWPNFNLADTYISIGILLMIVFYGRIKRTNK